MLLSFLPPFAANLQVRSDGWPKYGKKAGFAGRLVHGAATVAQMQQS